MSRSILILEVTGIELRRDEATTGTDAEVGPDIVCAGIDEAGGARPGGDTEAGRTGAPAL